MTFREPDGKMSLYHHAEPVPPTGGLQARGMQSALGRPSMNRWALLVREAVQNSWDARSPDSSGPVRFGLDLRQPTKEEHDALRDLVFGERGPVMGRSYWEQVDQPDQWFLTVHDRGTVGLRGPERADDVGQSNNFSDFVWNFGAQKEQEHTGGTYGYGRSVFFTVGQPPERLPAGPGSDAAVIVHSRYRDGERVRSRLIAMGLASQVEREWTGRNWWGRNPAGQLPVGPVEDEEADVLAELLGLPPFANGETGTTILVPCCDLTESHDEQKRDPTAAARLAMEKMKDAALWHCWPKLVDLGNGPEMQFSFSIPDQTVEAPQPEKHPEIRHFVDCLRRCLPSQAGTVDEPDTLAMAGSASLAEVRSEKPKKHLGVLSMKRFVTQPKADLDSPGRPFTGDLHHTALMRTPKLIVKYLPGPESPVEHTRWAGVFIADEGVDKTFANSEPPPHDDWVVVPGAKYERNLVKIGLKRIDQKVKEFNTLPAPEPPPGNGPLGPLADALGELLEGGPAGGPGNGAQPPPRGRSQPARARLNQKESFLRYENGRRRLYVPFTVMAQHGADRTLVQGKVSVAINDGSGSEKEPPTGVFQPKFRGFLTPRGELRETASVEVAATDNDEWKAVAELPPDVAVRVILTAE